MEPSRKRLVTGIAIFIGAVLIFLAGYLPGASRAGRAAEESRLCANRAKEMQATLDQTRFDLQVATLRGRLGDVLHDANVNNFGKAGERATTFFDGLRSATASAQLPAGSERRKVLETVLARRDEISADLARADQGVKNKLAEMYMQFGEAVTQQ